MDAPESEENKFNSTKSPPACEIAPAHHAWNQHAAEGRPRQQGPHRASSYEAPERAGIHESGGSGIRLRLSLAAQALRSSSS